MNHLKDKSISGWLPGIFAELAAGVFCLIYFVIDGSEWAVYFDLTVSALLPFVFPVYSLISRKRLPVVLGVVSAVFIFLSCNLGSALGFYDRIASWDLIMHGYFGFACSLTAFVFLLRWNGNRLHPVGFMLIIFMFTMGVAALWEVWEFLLDIWTGSDSQDVIGSVAQGKSPVSDTMEDLIVAIAGSAIFYLTLIVDKLAHHKIYGPICSFTGFVK